jgi:hypothetical protein
MMARGLAFNWLCTHKNLPTAEELLIESNKTQKNLKQNKTKIFRTRKKQTNKQTRKRRYPIRSISGFLSYGYAPKKKINKIKKYLIYYFLVHA